MEYIPLIALLVSLVISYRNNRLGPKLNQNLEDDEENYIMDHEERMMTQVFVR